jgi:hypothetical protein
MYRIERYDQSHAAQWNSFVRASKNGTFLFDRNFMDYHADRFEDYSLMVFEGDKIRALLPAHIIDGNVYSHWGLTYGGLILQVKAGFEKVEQMFMAILKWISYEGVKKLYYKEIPQFYFKYPSFETDIVLNKVKAKLIRKDINLAVDFNSSMPVSESKLKNYRKRKDTGFRIEAGNDFAPFWDLLSAVLNSKYKSKPIHSFPEIELLHNRFPENIVQYNIYHEDEILAGITLFVFDGVIKSQYGASTAKGEKMRALDYLFITIIEKFKDEKAFFDMGTVMTDTGYNKGLLKQKEEFGCAVYSQDFYEVETSNYVLLENILV